MKIVIEIEVPEDQWIQKVQEAEVESSGNISGNQLMELLIENKLRSWADIQCSATVKTNKYRPTV